MMKRKIKIQEKILRSHQEIKEEILIQDRDRQVDHRVMITKRKEGIFLV